MLGDQIPHSVLPSTQRWAPAQQEIPVTNFWDSTKDSLFAVNTNSEVVAVYVDSNKAAFAAEEVDGHLTEIKNSDLSEFWFNNSHLTVKY